MSLSDNIREAFFIRRILRQGIYWNVSIRQFPALCLLIYTFVYEDAEVCRTILLNS
jgi:hypothetical protein